MPNIGDAVQHQSLDSDTPRAAIVTSVAADGTVGLFFPSEQICAQGEYVPYEKDEKGKIINHDVAASGYVVAAPEKDAGE